MNGLYFSLIKANVFGVVIVIILMAIVLSKRKIVKPLKKDLSPRTVGIIDILARALLSLVIIATIFYITIPVLGDTVWVLRQEDPWSVIPQKEGEVVKKTTFLFGFWFIKQDIYFSEDKTGYRMFLMNGPVTIGSHYSIRFLPRSRSVVKILYKDKDSGEV